MKDIIINYTAGLGTPKIIFVIAKVTSEHSGAAAMTSRLKDFSMEMGMEEGIGVFVAIGIISYQLASYFQTQYYKSKIERDRLALKLKNTEFILQQIDSYAISKLLRKKLKTEYLLPN